MEVMAPLVQAIAGRIRAYGPGDEVFVNQRSQVERLILVRESDPEQPSALGIEAACMEFDLVIRIPWPLDRHARDRHVHPTRIR